MATIILAMLIVMPRLKDAAIGDAEEAAHAGNVA